MQEDTRYCCVGPLLTVWIAFAVLAMARSFAAEGSAEWSNYGNDSGGMRFSPLTQISRKNVSELKTAWVFHTGDISDGKGRPRSGFESTPLFVDDTLFVTTPFNRVIALDPATGRQRWAFDPKIDQTWQSGDGLINRGLATWVDSKRALNAPCRRRLFEATIDARLVAVDAATGSACADFGKNGEVSLREVPGFHAGWYHMTSPPAVVDDIVVVGSSIDDNARVDMPSGVVRAFDARSGALRWSWDPIQPNAGNFRSGAANAWSIMTVDPERHLVFVPTGSASPDYFGGLRPGDDKWADSVVALRADTGKLNWGFQLVHHDLWDFDVASPPLLTTLAHEGAKIPVVIAGDKSGFLYVLNRDTGVPVFKVEERPVPQSDVPGEVTSPTQPIPVAPPPLVPQQLKLWGATRAEYEACRTQVQGLRADGVFTPPTIQGTVSTPGNLGGLNWSGYAFDPQRGLLIANTNNVPYRGAAHTSRGCTRLGIEADPGTRRIRSSGGVTLRDVPASVDLPRESLLRSAAMGNAGRRRYDSRDDPLAGAARHVHARGSKWATGHSKPGRADGNRRWPGFYRGYLSRFALSGV